MRAVAFTTKTLWLLVVWLTDDDDDVDYVACSRNNKFTINDPQQLLGGLLKWSD